MTDDPWTCPCGHELSQDDERVCLVWDPDKPHRVPTSWGECECHGIPLQDLEAWKYRRRRWSYQ